MVGLCGFKEENASMEFDVLILHGILWSIHVGILHGYQGGQFPVDKAFSNSALHKLWLYKRAF